MSAVLVLGAFPFFCEENFTFLLLRTSLLSHTPPPPTLTLRVLFFSSPPSAPARLLCFCFFPLSLSIGNSCLPDIFATSILLRVLPVAALCFVFRNTPLFSILRVPFYEFNVLPSTSPPNYAFVCLARNSVVRLPSTSFARSPASHRILRFDLHVSFHSSFSCCFRGLSALEVERDTTSSTPLSRFLHSPTPGNPFPKFSFPTSHIITSTHAAKCRKAVVANPVITVSHHPRHPGCGISGSEAFRTTSLSRTICTRSILRDERHHDSATILDTELGRRPALGTYIHLTFGGRRSHSALRHTGLPPAPTNKTAGHVPEDSSKPLDRRKLPNFERTIPEGCPRLICLGLLSNRPCAVFEGGHICWNARPHGLSSAAYATRPWQTNTSEDDKHGILHPGKVHTQRMRPGADQILWAISQSPDRGSYVLEFVVRTWSSLLAKGQHLEYDVFDAGLVSGRFLDDRFQDNHLRSTRYRTLLGYDLTAPHRTLASRQRNKILDSNHHITVMIA